MWRNRGWPRRPIYEPIGTLIVCADGERFHSVQELGGRCACQVTVKGLPVSPFLQEDETSRPSDLLEDIEPLAPTFSTSRIAIALHERDRAPRGRWCDVEIADRNDDCRRCLRIDVRQKQQR